MQEKLANLQKMINSFTSYKDERISLISSENISSDLVKLSYSLGMSDQYCSRLPKNKNVVDNLTFSNTAPLDEINDSTRKLVMQLFNAKECDVRLLSGLSGLNVVLHSLLNCKDTLFRIDDSCGGHLSTAPIANKMGVKHYGIKYNKDFRIDLNQFRELHKKHKPNAVLLDSSYLLFPYPLEEIREIVGSETPIIYDASHVIALIGAGLFQKPFEEGADMIHATTHKSLWGPQKAMILFKENTDLVGKVHSTVGDLVSNTHMHHNFALYIALLEYQEFGKEYAENLQNNAQYFAKKLSENGLNIAASEHGFTRTNQFWVDFGTKEKTSEEFRKLEQLGISANVIFLPEKRWGWRFAVNELTRLGVSETELDSLAKIISDAVLNRKLISKLKNDCVDFMQGLKEVKFSFDNTQEGKNLMNMIAERFISEPQTREYCLSHKYFDYIIGSKSILVRKS